MKTTTATTTATETVTQKEMSVLLSILINEYNAANYGLPETADDTWTYSWAIAECSPYSQGLTKRSVGGVMASLVKKELAWAHNDGTEESGCGLTEAGYEIAKAEHITRGACRKGDKPETADEIIAEITELAPAAPAPDTVPKVTKLEKQTIMCIAENEFNDGYNTASGLPQTPQDTESWTNRLDVSPYWGGLKQTQIPAILCNLRKKGLATAPTSEGKDRYVALTDLGFTVYSLLKVDGYTPEVEAEVLVLGSAMVEIPMDNEPLTEAELAEMGHLELPAEEPVVVESKPKSKAKAKAKRLSAEAIAANDTETALRVLLGRVKALRDQNMEDISHLIGINEFGEANKISGAHDALIDVERMITQMITPAAKA